MSETLTTLKNVKVEGKSLLQISRAADQDYKVVRARYRRFMREGKPISIKTLTTDHRGTWSLIGLNIHQWIEFLEQRGVRISPPNLRSFTNDRRRRGLDDKTIARKLLARYNIKLKED